MPPELASTFISRSCAANGALLAVLKLALRPLNRGAVRSPWSWIQPLLDAPSPASLPSTWPGCEPLRPAESSSAFNRPKWSPPTSACPVECVLSKQSGAIGTLCGDCRISDLVSAQACPHADPKRCHFGGSGYSSLPMISRVMPVNPFHPYLGNDTAPSSDPQPSAHFTLALV